MEWWGEMIFPLRKAWTRVGRRLGIRKTGLVKLRRDVKTCEYEDVHILWEMLKKNKTGLTRAARVSKGDPYGVLSIGLGTRLHLFAAAFDNAASYTTGIAIARSLTLDRLPSILMVCQLSTWISLDQNRR